MVEMAKYQMTHHLTKANLTYEFWKSHYVINPAKFQSEPEEIASRPDQNFRIKQQKIFWTQPIRKPETMQLKITQTNQPKSKTTEARKRTQTCLDPTPICLTMETLTSVVKHQNTQKMTQDKVKCPYRNQQLQHVQRPCLAPSLAHSSSSLAPSVAEPCHKFKQIGTELSFTYCP